MTFSSTLFSSFFRYIYLVTLTKFNLLNYQSKQLIVLLLVLLLLLFSLVYLFLTMQKKVNGSTNILGWKTQILFISLDVGCRLGWVLRDFVWFTITKIEFLPDEMNFWSDQDSKHFNSNSWFNCTPLYFVHELRANTGSCMWPHIWMVL